MATNTSKYTYTMFASEVIGIVEGSVEVTPAVRERVTLKANDLLNAQAVKKAYNAEHPRKNQAKGASAETMAKVNAIKGVLSSTPMTAAEINAALDADYTALQVANACKFIEGVATTKVVRPTVNAKGLKAEKEYTAYFLS